MSLTRVRTTAGWVDLQKVGPQGPQGVAGPQGDPGVAGGSPPTGALIAFCGATAPTGYTIADGTAKLRAGTDPDGKSYVALFAVIGTAYGIGNGSTTFNLPNLKGAVPAGRDAAQTEFDVLGESGGAKTHVLTTAQLATHTHVQDTHGHKFQDPAGNGVGSYRTNTVINNPSGVDLATVYSSSSNQLGVGNTVAVNQNTGSNQAHNNLQPYQVVNYLIKL